MFVKDQLRHLHWQDYKRIPNYLLSEPWRSWVLDRGSLTQRLIDASQGDFRVEVLRQETDHPLPSEREALGLSLRQSCVIREVALLCHEQPWVYARSIMPTATLTGAGRQLAHLGTKPLGAFLFKAPDMHRGPLEITRYENLFEGDNSRGWGRRSIFYLNERPLLVCEFFLPRMMTARRTGLPRQDL